MNHYSVIIVGGGQAGLSLSYCLKQYGIDHVVLEKIRLAMLGVTNDGILFVW